MKKARTRGSVVNAVFAADKKAYVQIRGLKFIAQLFSADAYMSLQDEVDLPVVSKKLLDRWVAGMPRATIVWEFPVANEEEERQIKPYMLDDGSKERVESVVEQEEDIAALIGGKRHRGSGSIEDFKSDASSKYFQAEGKQTKALSFVLSLAILNKIHREAKTTMKMPLLHVRFKKVPKDMSVPEDWVAIPAQVFERMVNLCGWE